jgi:hypothetical protein
MAISVFPGADYDSGAKAISIAAIADRCDVDRKRLEVGLAHGEVALSSNVEPWQAVPQAHRSHRAAPCPEHQIRRHRAQR